MKTINTPNATIELTSKDSNERSVMRISTSFTNTVVHLDKESAKALIDALTEQLSTMDI